MKKIILFILILIFINQINIYAKMVTIYDDEMSDFGKDTMYPEIAQNLSLQKNTNKYSKDDWIKSSDGRWWYRHKDGSYTKDDWEKIDDKWYLFDKSGWMLYGWQYRRGSYYYLGKSSDGSMKIGWEKVDDKWYFMNSDGKMRTSTLIQNNRTYTFFSSGELQTTIININKIIQKQSRWCWAASAKMVGTYGINYNITQEEIVNHVKKMIIDKGANDKEFSDAINFASNNTKITLIDYNRIYDFKFVVDKIDKNKLMGVHFTFDGIPFGHAIVFSGYRVGETEAENKIYIVDPDKNATSRFYYFNELLNGCKMDSGQGRILAYIYY